MKNNLTRSKTNKSFDYFGCMKENEIKTETHPLDPFFPDGAQVLMLGSFPRPDPVGRWIFIILISKTICGVSSVWCFSRTKITF